MGHAKIATSNMLYWSDDDWHVRNPHLLAEPGHIADGSYLFLKKKGEKIKGGVT